MRFLFLSLFLALLLSCSGSSEMPEVEFVSPSAAKVIYQGREYLLEKDKPAPADFPFEYRFEEDGDLDLRINGRWVEFDNPFDLDFDFKLKKKKTKFKTKKVRRLKPRRTKKRR
ncbi:MAG: hypothetical protein GXO17_03355 [Thermodesulfobacteria bacterium]|nr:hypothetical protein [Thermodesulfobacteriota bacterium]